MVTIKLTLCGRGPGNSPRASSLSGECSEKDICMYGDVSLLMSVLEEMQSAAYNKYTYSVYKILNPYPWGRWCRNISTVMGNHNIYTGNKVWNPRFFPQLYAKHTNLFLLRFEMPYNIWCDGCKNHIGMGKVEAIFAFSVSSVCIFLFLTLILCLHRGPLQRREKESGHLLQYTNLQVNSDKLGQLLSVQFTKFLKKEK